VRDAGVGDVIDAGLEAIVPASRRLPRLPVKPLHRQIIARVKAVSI
jgi:hypothetical protein